MVSAGAVADGDGDGAVGDEAGRSSEPMAWPAVAEGRAGRWRRQVGGRVVGRRLDRRHAGRGRRGGGAEGARRRAAGGDQDRDDGERRGVTAWAGDHVPIPGAGSVLPRHRRGGVSTASPAGNGSVTGSVSAKIRPPPGPRTCPQRRAEQRGVLGRDREAEPGAAARARRVRLVEAVEDPRERRRAGRRALDRRRRSSRRPSCASATPPPARRARGRGRCPRGCRGSGRAVAGPTRRRRASRAARSRPSAGACITDGRHEPAEVDRLRG